MTATNPMSRRTETGCGVLRPRASGRGSSARRFSTRGSSADEKLGARTAAPSVRSSWSASAHFAGANNSARIPRTQRPRRKTLTRPDPTTPQRHRQWLSPARTRLEHSFDPDSVRDMKRSATSDLTVGGANLAARAFKAGLVDESHLFIAPVLVGGGKPALPRDTRAELELVDERRFATGVVYLRYRRPRLSKSTPTSTCVPLFTTPGRQRPVPGRRVRCPAGDYSP